MPVLGEEEREACAADGVRLELKRAVAVVFAFVAECHGGERDIAALSEHYSQLPFRPAVQDFDPNLVPVGAELHEKYCEKCHEQGGRHADSAPILAGQWIPYLRTSLKYVPTGEHLVPPLMEKTVADMGKDEINALMSFYASRQE